MLNKKSMEETPLAHDYVNFIETKKEENHANRLLAQRNKTAHSGVRSSTDVNS